VKNNGGYMKFSGFGSDIMEDNSLNHQNGAQIGPQTVSVANNKQNEETNPKTQYSIPGILHFIQHEWARFELERSQWEVDRAELQVSYSMLIFPQRLFVLQYVAYRCLHVRASSMDCEESLPH
jgi:hypothetical protein